jgi:hypothetical protein
MKKLLLLAVIFASCEKENIEPQKPEPYNYWNASCNCEEIIINKLGAVESVKQPDGTYKSFWFHAGIHTQDSLGVIRSYPFGTLDGSEYTKYTILTKYK